MSGEKKAFPKFVITYNEILGLIQQGLYPEESKLPPEEELALQMNVSRMTLRKSLNLLKEDGIIEARHGMGNYVRKQTAKAEIGMEKPGSPVRKVVKHQPDQMDFSMELRPANEYIQHIFKRKGSVSLEARRRYRFQGLMVGYSYSAILGDVLDGYELDLNKEEQVRRFLELDIYEHFHRVRMEMKVPSRPGFIRPMKEEFYRPDRLFLMIFEEIYNQKGEMLVFTKHFIPYEEVDLLLNWYH